MSMSAIGFSPTTKSSNVSLTDLPSGTVSARATKIGGSDNHSIACSTYGQKYGKKYFEFISRDHGATGQKIVGITATTSTSDSYYPGNSSLGVGYGFRQNDGNKVNASTFTAYGSNWNTASPTIIGVAVDFDNLKIWFSINDVWQNSGDPVAGTGQAFTITSPGTGFYYPAGTCYSTTNPSVLDIAMKTSDLTYAPPTGFEAWEVTPNATEVEAIDQDLLSYNTTSLIGYSPIVAQSIPFPIVLPSGTLRIAGDSPNGLVLVASAPASRVVDLFDRETGTLVGRTTSSGSGTFSFENLSARTEGYDVVIRGNINVGERDVIFPGVHPV